MQTLLDNGAYELGNLGDVVMLQVAVSRLQRLWPQSGIHVLTDHPKQLTELCPGVLPLPAEGRNLWFQERNLFGGAYRLLPDAATPALEAIESSVRRHMHQMAEPWIRRRLRQRQGTSSLDSYRQALRDADLVAASGGGYINDAFPRHAKLVLETLEEAQNRGKATAMLGQGLGPLTNPSLRRLARRVLPRLACLTLREGRFGLPLALALGMAESQVTVTGDDAVEAAYAARPPCLGSSLGVNVRLASYSGLGDDDLDRLAVVLNRVLAELGTRPIALPVSFHTGDSDSRSLTRLFARLPGQPPVPDRLDPSEALARVGQCRLVLTGSYHAGVFALSQGIPVVALAGSAYYESKFEGLAEQFSGGVLSIPRARISQVLGDAILASWEQAPALRAPLLAASARQIEDGQRAYRKLGDVAAQPAGTA